MKIEKKWLSFAVISVLVILGALLLSKQLGVERKSTMLDQRIPTFSLPTIDGQYLTTEDIKGHWTILHFWATWCNYCVQEHDERVKAHYSKDVAVFAIAYKDAEQNVIEFVTERGHPYQKIGLDYTGQAAIAFAVKGMPNVLIIDPNGVIRYRHAGSLAHYDLMHQLEQIQHA